MATSAAVTMVKDEPTALRAKIGGPGAASTARDLADTYLRGIDMAERTCSIDGCEKRSRARGWCVAHYRRWKLYGDPLGEASRPSMADRFWPKVDKNGPVPECRPDLGPCWLWTGGIAANGYACFDRNVKAHRFSYEISVGPIPEGLVIDHLCRVHNCVNPKHLEPVTEAENILRGEAPPAINARKTHCPKGHAFSPGNTYRYPDGRRECLTCRRAYMRAYYRKRSVRA